MSFINIVMSALTSAYNWLMQLVNSLGMYSYVIGILLLMLIFRFILRPLMSGGIPGVGSDNAASRFMARQINKNKGRSN